MLCYAKKSAKYNLINLLTLYRGNFPKFIPKSAGLHCLLSLLFLAQDFMSSKLCCLNIFFLDPEYSSFLMGLRYNSNIEAPRDLVVSFFLALVSPHDSRFLSP